MTSATAEGTLAILLSEKLSSSVLLSLQKTASAFAKGVQFRVWTPEADDPLVDRLPRHMVVHSGPYDVVTVVAELPESSVVFKLADSLLLTPECIPVAVSMALSSPGTYVTLVDHTSKEASLDVSFSSSRHWSTGSGVCKSFAVTSSAYKLDEDVFKEFQYAPVTMLWSALRVLRNRKILCPIPSLAAPLPLSDTTNPPGVPWAQIQEFISRAS